MAKLATSLQEYRALKETLEKGKPLHSLYLLYGKEPYFINHLSDLFLQCVVPPEAQSFNQHLLYGAEVQQLDFAAMCLRAPLNTPRRLVLVREAQTIKKLDTLIEYAARPLSSTVLVLCYHDDIKGRGSSPKQRLLSLFAKNGVAYKAAPLYDYQMYPLLSTMLQEYNLQAPASIQELLLNLIGPNPIRLEQEVGRLRMLLPQNENTLTPQFVHATVSDQREYAMYELPEALAMGNRAQALRISNYFAQTYSSGEFIPIVSMVYSYFRNLFLYQMLRSQMQASALAKRLGVMPFVLRRYAQAARHYDINDCAAIFTHLRRLDLQAKGLGAAPTSLQSQLQQLIALVLGYCK